MRRIIPVIVVLMLCIGAASGRKWNMPNNDGSVVLTGEGYYNANLQLKKNGLDSMMWRLRPDLAEKYWAKASSACQFSQIALELCATVDTFYIFAENIKTSLRIKMLTKNSQVLYEWNPEKTPSLKKTINNTNPVEFFKRLNNEVGYYIKDFNPGSYYRCIVKDSSVAIMFITTVNKKDND